VSRREPPKSSSRPPAKSGSGKPGRPVKPTRKTGSGGRRPLPAQQQRKPLPVLLIGGAVVAVIAVVALVLSLGGDGGGGEEPEVEQFQEMTVRGTALPPFPANAGATDPAVGAAAPSLAGADFAGAAQQVNAGDGRPKVLVFLAHWCPHCQREVPLISKWVADKGRPEGVDVIGIATGTTPARPNYPPSEWLERERWPFPVLADDRTQSASRAFGLSSYPFFVFVGADGKVAGRTAGELETDRLEQAIAALAAGDTANQQGGQRSDVTTTTAAR
jgi:cytochrome c biogenesis protein CcmG/thiol:disulfide interchange protein DsbE